MPQLRIQSPAEQVAEHLRSELLLDRWGGSIPGVLHLASELGVDHKTVMLAMQLLEEEGLLVNQGPGRRRRVILPEKPVTSLRIAHLLYDRSDSNRNYTVDLHYLLQDAGHVLVHPPNSQEELNFNAPRIRQLVERTEADAWIVSAGSQEVLAYFSQQDRPAFAFFGRMQGLPLAGVKPDKSPPVKEAVHQLYSLGHRRIAMLCRTERRRPSPGRFERAFLDGLESHGIQTGRYNLPDWEDSSGGFQVMLESLFHVTPPTALILSEAFLYTATLKFLSQRGIRVPMDVSLICTDDDPTFAWCSPPVPHIAWDTRPVIRRIVRWAANISRNREDHKQTLTKAEFVAAGLAKVKGEKK